MNFSQQEQASLDAVFSALADPTRRAILARLTQGDASVGELAAPFALSLPTVSRHIDVLEQAGLVLRERDAQWRVCHFRREALTEAAGWIDRYLAFWDSRLDALARFVESPSAAEKPRTVTRASRPRQAKSPPRKPRSSS